MKRVHDILSGIQAGESLIGDLAAQISCVQQAVGAALRETQLLMPNSLLLGWI